MISHLVFILKILGYISMGRKHPRIATKVLSFVMKGTIVTNVTQKKTKRRNRKNILNGGSHHCNDNIVTPLLEFSNLAINISGHDLEMALYQLLRQIRDRQLEKQGVDSRNVGSELPSWPPCPPYRQRYRGIVNVKNTCYLLSCIQSLFSLPVFVGVLDHLSAGMHSIFADVGSLRRLWSEDLATTTPLLRLFLLLLDDIAPYKPNQPDGGKIEIPTDFGYVSTGKPLKLDPKFFEVLTFEPGVEQDAADCMSRILTQLHEEMAEVFRKFKPAETKMKKEQPWWELPSDQQDGGDKDDEGWTTVVTNGKKLAAAREIQVDNGEVTPISLIFGGNTISRSSYAKASRTANKSDICVKERFFVLPMEINSPQVRQIEDGFRLLSKGEVLSDFKDPETGNCVVMSRRVFIDQLPPVLLIQLNRFFYSTPGDKNCDQFAIHKVLKQIPIHKKLKIAEEVVSKDRAFSQAQGTYDLHAVIFHHGYGAARGHYTTTLNLRPTLLQGSQGDDGDLIYFDDERVFRLRQRSEGESMYSSHRPFDWQTCQFRKCRSLSITKRGPCNTEEAPLPSSIAEQPRTPYILVYTSTFKPNK